MSGEFQARALALHQAGHRVVPLPHGRKGPTVKGWQGLADTQTEEDVQELVRKANGAGVGVLAKWTPAVDVDVREPELAQQLAGLAHELLGHTVERIGQAPKLLLPYRAEAPFPKITSRGFRLRGDGPDDKLHRVEILADGQQWAAYHTHPDTGRAYAWPEGDLPARDDLPEITVERARLFIERAEAVIIDAGGVPAGSEHPASSGGAGAASLHGPAGTPEAVADALRYVPNADASYDEWVCVGYAIKGGVGEAGLPLWIDWSAKSHKHVQATSEKAWRGFKPKSIGAGSLYHRARQNGWKPDPSLILNAATAEAVAKVDLSGLKQAARQATPLHDPETGEVLEERESQAPPVLPTPVTPLTQLPALEGGEIDIVADAGGVLGELVDWMTATARFPQPLLNLGAAIATCGTLMGHRYRLLDGPDTRTNVMILALAGSGSGKDHPRRCVMQALSHAGLSRYYHGRSIASAQGIVGNLANFFAGVMLVDEVGHVLAGVMGERAPPHLRAIANLLTELSTSASGLFVDDARAGNRDPDAVRYDVPDPCFGLFATTVPEPLWAALNSGHAIDGFLARFLMLETPQNYPDPVFDTEPMGQRLDSVALSLRRLVVGPGGEPTDLAVAASLGSLQPRWEGQGPGRKRHVRPPEVPVVPMTPAAKAMDREATVAEVTAKRAHEGKTLATSIIARTCEHVRRLALIRAVSRNPQAPVVDAPDMAWARAVVALSQARMIPAVEANVADNRWEADLKKVLRIIRQHGDWMSGDQLCDKLKFLKKRDRNEAIAELIEAGKLNYRTEPTATKPRTLIRAAKEGQK